MPPYDFDHPWALLLLPLALLPLRRQRRDALMVATLDWLPVDRLGSALGALWRALAVAAMAATVLGLAGPGQGGEPEPRSGRGAEVLILMDRSSSMDAVVHLNAPATAGGFSVTESKAEIVRRLLQEFIARRPDDRLAFMAFGTSPMAGTPFTDDNAVVQAALAATAIGRGLPNTNMGPALLAAIREFEGRPYSGSRIVLVVSDGGAQLDEPTRERIRAGLAAQRIGLYWIYIRSGPNAPSLVGEAAGSTTYVSEGERELHDFFGSLPTPYHLFQTDDAHAMEAAMAEIDRQQNFPLGYFERTPRRDHSRLCFAAALLCAAALLALRLLQLLGWRVAA